MQKAAQEGADRLAWLQPTLNTIRRAGRQGQQGMLRAGDRLRDFYSQLPEHQRRMLTGTLVGGGLGGLTLGTSQWLNQADDRESTPGRRRRLVARDALIGSLLGASAGLGLSHLSRIPVPTPEDFAKREPAAALRKSRLGLQAGSLVGAAGVARGIHHPFITQSGAEAALMADKDFQPALDKVKRLYGGIAAEKPWSGHRPPARTRLEQAEYRLGSPADRARSDLARYRKRLSGYLGAKGRNVSRRAQVSRHVSSVNRHGGGRGWGSLLWLLAPMLGAAVDRQVDSFRGARQ